MHIEYACMMQRIGKCILDASVNIQRIIFGYLKGIVGYCMVLDRQRYLEFFGAGNRRYTNPNDAVILRPQTYRLLPTYLAITIVVNGVDFLTI